MPESGLDVNVQKKNAPREAWESRATDLGVQLSSVLCRGLPLYLNAAMDDWHRHLLQLHFLGFLPPRASLLDAGCGYGRLSRFIHESRPDLAVIGCDFAHGYCVAFSKYVETPAVCMALERSAFAPNTFDGIVAMNALMYLDTAARASALQQLRESLVPGGTLLLLEPGLEYFNLLSRIGFGSPTGGQGFSLGSFRELAIPTEWRVLKSGSALAFSACLPLLGFAARLGLKFSWPVKLALRWDGRSGSLSKWSAYRWQLMQRV